MFTRLLKKNLLLFSIVFTSCTSKSAIPISDTLEIALGDRYSRYLSLLNKSALNDTTALVEFLVIDNIYDGAGYDHGWVVIELMKKLGDKQFSDALYKMNRNQIDNLKEYFRVGLDGYSKSNIDLPKKYPLTFTLLGFAEKELL